MVESFPGLVVSRFGDRMSLARAPYVVIHLSTVRETMDETTEYKEEVVMLWWRGTKRRDDDHTESTTKCTNKTYQKILTKLEFIRCIRMTSTVLFDTNSNQFFGVNVIINLTYFPSTNIIYI